jgi:hypothetical protein
MPARLDAVALPATQLDHDEVDRGHHGEDRGDQRGQQDTLPQQQAS